MIRANEIKICVDVLTHYTENCKLFGFQESEVNSMREALSIMRGELSHEEEQLAHSEVTIEMEQGKDIPLAEWARKWGLDESYARQKARRGSLRTAHKIGRDWFISELEENRDNRRKP